MEEITLIYRGEKIRFGEPDEDCTAILNCMPLGGQTSLLADEPTLVKVECRYDEFKVGLAYLFYGHWTTYKSKVGDVRQFAAKTFRRCQPHGQQAVVRYLCEAPFIGPSTANTLWAKFQGDCLRILRETPDVAAAAIGGHFDEEKALAASKWLEQEHALEHCTIGLTELFDGRKLPKKTVKWAIYEWGNKAIDFIRRNPFLLRKFRGIGFKKCDDMYRDFGLPEGRFKRQALCIEHFLSNDRIGHTWFNKSEVVSGLRAMIPAGSIFGAWISDGRRRRLEKLILRYGGDGGVALALLVRAKRLRERTDERGVWFAVEGKAKNEEVIASRIAALMAGPVCWPPIDGLAVSDHQRAELAPVIQSPVGLFTGAPGTGKTYTIARLIARVIELHGAGQVALCAPTGKAASRLREALAGYGISIHVGTIHSLLGVCKLDGGEGWGFAHNEEDPLPQKFFFMDEGSMPDADIFSAFLRALPPGAQLIVVGDTNQLPPVGHGAPLRDLIKAGVPKGELKEIQRQAAGSRIVNICHAIRDGRSWDVPAVLNPATGENVAMSTTRDGDDSVEKIVDKLHAIAIAGLADPIWDCQVIVAVNAKSPLARTALNKRLQVEFNPSGKKGDGPFRVGDKIICLKNGLYKGEEKGDESFIANGEIGRVANVDGKVTLAKFTAPDRTVKIIGGAEPQEGEEEESEDNGKKFDLAYAVTCHKMQGSEAKAVFVCLDDYPGARGVCGREWIYTAISRAKQICFLVGKFTTARDMCYREKLSLRKTFLAEQLSLLLQAKAVRK